MPTSQLSWCSVGVSVRACMHAYRVGTVHSLPSLPLSLSPSLPLSLSPSLPLPVSLSLPLSLTPPFVRSSCSPSCNLVLPLSASPPGYPCPACPQPQKSDQTSSIWDLGLSFTLNPSHNTRGRRCVMLASHGSIALQHHSTAYHSIIS